MLSILITDLTPSLLHNSLTLPDGIKSRTLARSHSGSLVREPVKIHELARPVCERAKFVYRSEHISHSFLQPVQT